MKQFIKMTLAVICGMIIVSLLGLFLLLGFVSALSIDNTDTSSPKSGVLAIDMSTFSLVEQAGEADPLDMIISGSTSASIGIWDAVQALKHAATDPAVDFIYLKPEGAMGGISTLQEFRKALVYCKKNGKAVISFVESPTTGSYYLASAADKVYMSSYPGSSYQINGISSQLIFLKDILDKLGINVQLIRHGKYKSAGEMYVKNAPSPENIEQNQVMINSIWKSYASEIAEDRRISVEDLNKAIDNLELNFPEDFIKTGLADELFTREQRLEKLADLAMVEKPEDIKTMKFTDYVKANVKPNIKAKKKIALIYADGEIVEGDGKTNVSGDYFAQVIADVRADSTVKAVVFRVNSPGGSVSASDKIKTEIDLLAAKKPVIASYGNYAASGGYWISNSCERIFANPTTLTGSIGVFSMIPEASRTLKEIVHINIVNVSSNKHGDMYSLSRPLDNEEYAYMQASVENIYDRFVTTVSEGRGLDPEFVDSIAQGRVWAGSDALGIGLIDEIGTLEDAVNYTASLAGDGNLDNWNIEAYPKPQTSVEKLMEMFGNSSASAEVLEGTPLEHIADIVLRWADGWKDGKGEMMFARMPYEILFN